jgi:hypothetical protein
MTRIPLTLKIEAAETALENLSKIEGRPLNELLREAIWDYLTRRNLNNLESGVLFPKIRLRTG